MTEPPKMEYTRLGSSGLKVSKVILGCGHFGSDKFAPWMLNEEESLPILEHAWRVGLNTWDTADVYSMGRSEEIIGKAIKKYHIPRSKLVILSKCYFGIETSGEVPPFSVWATNDGAMVNEVGLSRKHIFDAVNASVARLGTYIDVLQIHRLDRDTPKDEIMRALNDVVESGKVRYIGASSMATWEFQMLQNIAERHGWHKFISMQNYYNLLYREEEREMLPYLKYTGVGCIPWSPMARGALARPYNSRDTLREKNDENLHKLIRSCQSDADKMIIDRVEEVAKKRGVSMATIATAWCILKGVMPILGLGSKERIDQAVENSRYKVNDEDVKYIEEPYLPKTRQGY